MGGLLSMTGFGAASVERDGHVARVEVRAVNHRHLQIKARVPSEFAGLEADVEAKVRARIGRGAVTLNLAIERAAADTSVGLNREAAQRWKESLDGLAGELGLTAPRDLSAYLDLPGVVSSGDELALDGSCRDAALEAVDGALDSLVDMRQREGEATSRDLLGHADAIEATVARISERMPEVVQGHHEALRARVAELVGSDVPAADLAREVALIADRMDVGEELARLASHLAQLRGLITAGGHVGRKLDFLAQEFFREANTTGSKCNDAEVAHLVVELKTFIERLREQVQNIE